MSAGQHVIFLEDKMLQKKLNDKTGSLIALLEKYNQAYRRGEPLVSDHEYDNLLAKLKKLDPENKFLHQVEPEKFEQKKQVKHPSPMLSTEKAYTLDQLARFVVRVTKEAGEIGIQNLEYKVTPKLDGLAGRDDGVVFASRGNGEVGFEISSAFAKGVIPIGGRGLGPGEVVIQKSYFKEHLAVDFEHPRNMVVGIISSDKLNDLALKALQAKAVHFVPYKELHCWTGSGEHLLQNIKTITTNLFSKTDYPVDGVVAEIINEAVKKYMGATAHHYRWQIAVKSKGETAITRVEKVIWQVGRTGILTPVLEVVPVLLSGANIRRVTAHNAGLIKKKKIGVGAEIEIIRSGEVIPKLERVIKTVEDPVLPETCPACNSSLDWENDFLKCPNHECFAQIEQKLSHFFKILGNIDWFGIKTVKKLVESGYNSLKKIYSLKENDFVNLGFGPVQSKNLAQALSTSKTAIVEDWRFLAAFGIPDLGKGDSRKLLSHYKLEKITQITAKQINKIYGFGNITSHSIATGLKQEKSIINHMLAMNFNLERTVLQSELNNLDNNLAGKRIVLTGKMKQGSRSAMKTDARKLGLLVQNTVNSKTDFLVTGDKAGSTKLSKAEKLGIQIISEARYMVLIKNVDVDKES